MQVSLWKEAVPGRRSGMPAPRSGQEDRGLGVPAALKLRLAGSGGHLQDGAEGGGEVGRGKEEVGRLHGRTLSQS